MGKDFEGRVEPKCFVPNLEEYEKRANSIRNQDDADGEHQKSVKDSMGQTRDGNDESTTLGYCGMD